MRPLATAPAPMVRAKNEQFVFRKLVETGLKISYAGKEAVARTEEP